MRTNLLIMGLLVAALAAAPQERREEVRIIKHAGVAGVEGGEPVHDVMRFVSAEFSWDEKPVKGAPYSAEAVTDTVQTLADGNRIVRKNTATIYRDGEGRTRREQTLDFVGPWRADKPLKSISISDPVARVKYSLDAEARVAHKMALDKMFHLPAPAPGVPFNIEIEEEVRTGEPRHEAVFISGPGAIERLPAGEAPEVKRESLGRQTVEGVQAEGERTLYTIPAGQIGNERPIEVVSERWYSPELQTVVLSRRNDPRFGETVYRLTNIRRDEPDPSLFQPPADYTIKEDEPPLRMLKRKKGSA